MPTNDHRLNFAGGVRTRFHPALDRADCDFDAYTDRDWQTAPPAGDGDYLFTWHEGAEGQPEGYWNGTQAEA